MGFRYPLPMTASNGMGEDGISADAAPRDISREAA
jgi:hypothetical protein